MPGRAIDTVAFAKPKGKHKRAPALIKQKWVHGNWPDPWSATELATWSWPTGPPQERYKSIKEASKALVCWLASKKHGSKNGVYHACSEESGARFCG